MSVSFKKMLEGVNAASKAEQSYLRKLRVYNRGVFEMKENLQKIILPTEEAKQSSLDILKEEQDKYPVYLKTDADKAKEEIATTKEIAKHKRWNADSQDL